MSWEEFRDLHEEQHLAELSPRTGSSYSCALNAFEAHCKPQRIADVTSARVAHFRTALRKAGLKPTTVANYLRHLAAAMNRGQSQGLVAMLPDCKPPKAARVSDRMKGRPITEGEFDDMLSKVEDVVGPEKAANWTFYVNAMWLSGLRLSESLTLTWDRSDNAISVDLSGKRAMLRIPAEVEKGKRDRLLPVTPDFAALLASVPPDRRCGKLFDIHQHAVNVSAVVGKIGKAAGVKVNDTKYASAHDLTPGLRYPVGPRAFASTPQGADAAHRHRYDDAILRR
ncbi:MAG: phage integrase SAM-like domain-containing protein [Planctomycetota bacterium]